MKDLTKQYEDITGAVKLQTRKAVLGISKEYDRQDIPASEFLSIRKLKESVNKLHNNALIDLHRDLDKEIGEAIHNSTVGNLEALRGNLEALRCIHSMIVDAVGNL
jgi:hypothetical protein